MPVDIAILEDGKTKIFIETKEPKVTGKREKRAAIEQLKDYMRFDEDVIWGVWTNGSDFHYIKKTVSNKKITFIDVYSVPLSGYSSVKEMLQIKDLIISSNLQPVFRSIRSYIAGHAVGTTRDEEIASELIKIILCKTYDEKFKLPDDYADFHTVLENDEVNAKKTVKKVTNLYKQVVQKYDEVFKADDEIKLDDDSIVYVVGQLEKYNLTLASRNIISDAFETIIGSSLKGEKGQFFTPKNIVQLIVEIVAPGKKDKILDPAAGFRVIIMIQANSQVNTRVLELLPKFKIKKMNRWCAV